MFVLELFNLGLVFSFIFGSSFVISAVLGWMFIVFALVFIIYDVFHDAILWVLWKKISVRIPKVFFEDLKGKNLDIPKAVQQKKARIFEGKENAIIAVLSFYASAIGLDSFDFLTIEHLLNNSTMFIVALFGTLLMSLFNYILFVRIAWIVFVRIIISYVYQGVTGKSFIPNLSFTVKEQKKEISKYYKKTINALDSDISSYKNLEFNEGLIISIKNSEIRLLFDYLLVQKPFTDKKGRNLRVPIYRLTAFFPNKTGKNGAIKSLMSTNHNLGLRAIISNWKFVSNSFLERFFSRLKCSEFDYSPCLETEAKSICSIMKELISSRDVRLGEDLSSNFRPFSVLFQKKGVMVYLSLSSTATEKEIKKSVETIKEIQNTLQ
jgi:hypothetical protein